MAKATKARDVLLTREQYMDYNEYMNLAKSLRQRLAHGDQQDLMKKLNISSTTLNNILNGYYMRDGLKVLYKPISMLYDIAEYVQEKEQARRQKMKQIKEML